MKLDKKSPICPIVHVDTKKNHPKQTPTWRLRKIARKGR